jgi:hypothetical protein
MSNPATFIDNLVMLRLKDINISSYSDEQLVATYWETRDQMEKAYESWHKRQPTKVV